MIVEFMIIAVHARRSDNKILGVFLFKELVVELVSLSRHAFFALYGVALRENNLLVCVHLKLNLLVRYF